jgi:hypothetical protein
VKPNHLRSVPDAPTSKEEDVGKNDDPKPLGEVAADALQAGGEELVMSSEQTTLIPACRIKFEGMAWDSLDQVPGLKTKMKFVVEATIVGHTQKVMADGEMREFANAKVLTVTQVDD